jgi:hypothetical protein
MFYENMKLFYQFKNKFHLLVSKLLQAFKLLIIIIIIIILLIYLFYLEKFNIYQHNQLLHFF